VVAVDLEESSVLILCVECDIFNDKPNHTQIWTSLQRIALLVMSNM